MLNISIYFRAFSTNQEIFRIFYFDNNYLDYILRLFEGSPEQFRIFWINYNQIISSLLCKIPKYTLYILKKSGKSWIFRPIWNFRTIRNILKQFSIFSRAAVIYAIQYIPIIVNLFYYFSKQNFQVYENYYFYN